MKGSAVNSPPEYGLHVPRLTLGQSTQVPMLRGTQRCSHILLRQLASKAAACNGAGAPLLASALAPLACSFAGLTTPVTAQMAQPSFTRVPAHSLHTSVGAEHLLVCTHNVMHQLASGI